MDVCFQIAECDSTKTKSDEYLSTLGFAVVFTLLVAKAFK